MHNADVVPFLRKRSTFASLLLLLVLGLCLAGCYKATFFRDVAPDGPVVEEWRSFWLFGLVGRQTVDVRQFCPSGVTRIVKTGGNFGTDLVSALTLGIWTPRKIYIQCGRGASVRSSDIRAGTIALGHNGVPKYVMLAHMDGTERVRHVYPGNQPGEWRVNVNEPQRDVTGEVQ